MSIIDTHPYVPCEAEYSAGPCYWDASEAGNGAGQDFYVTSTQEVIDGLPVNMVGSPVMDVVGLGAFIGIMAIGIALCVVIEQKIKARRR